MANEAARVTFSLVCTLRLSMLRIHRSTREMVWFMRRRRELKRRYEGSSARGRRRKQILRKVELREGAVTRLSV